MRSKANTVDALIAKRLCINDTIRLYDLHKEFRVSPAQVAGALQRLSAIGAVVSDSKEVRRTPQFTEAMIVARHFIFGRDLSWKKPRLRSRVDTPPSRGTIRKRGSLF